MTVLDSSTAALSPSPLPQFGTRGLGQAVVSMLIVRVLWQKQQSATLFG